MIKQRRSLTLSGLNGLRVNGQWCKDPPIIKERVKEFFMDSFRAKQRVHLRLDNVSFNTISCVDNALLMGRILEEEIKEVVWNCDNSKSLRLDKFNFGFIKFCYEELKGDV